MAVLKASDKAAVLREQADDAVKHAMAAAKAMRTVLAGRDLFATVRDLDYDKDTVARASRARALLKLVAIECDEVAASARDTVDRLTALLEHGRRADD